MPFGTITLLPFYNKKTMKVGLTIIVKDKENAIVHALSSTKALFDFYAIVDTGSTDRTVERIRQWCKSKNVKYKILKRHVGKDYESVTVNGKEILGEFNAPRNDSFQLCKDAGMDFVFWMDSDDTLYNPELIHSHADKMRANGIAAELMVYNYAKPMGKVKPVVQKRERLIDLKYAGSWQNWVHENYLFEEPVQLSETDEIWLDHERTQHDVFETGRRNMLIMHKQLDKEGIESFSESMLNNLAYDHWEHKEYTEAIKYYQLLLDRGNKVPNDLRYEIYTKISRAYLESADNDNALVYANKAHAMAPQMAYPHLLMAEVYANQQSHPEAIYHANKVLEIGKPNTPSPINELEFLVIPRKIIINSYLATGRIQEAADLATQVLEIEGSPQAKFEKFTIDSELITQRAVQGIDNLVTYFQHHNKMEHADRLKEAIPVSLLDHHMVRNMIKVMMHDWKRKVTHIELEGPKSIVIYAGEGVIDPWDGHSDIEKGIGGSEGMCIQISRELAKLGNKVTVYNDCGASSGKEFDGVMYEDYRKWSPKMKCDVFISLRRADIFQHIIKAKKQYLWLHDTEYGMMPQSLFYAPNKTFVLTEAHKAVIKENHGLKDDSIFHLTRNGLNPIAMDYAKKNAGKRDPYQVIYASSYDRGLDNVLDMWPTIKAAVPQATLKIFYGWNTFDKLMNARLGTPQGNWMKNYKSEMVEKIAHCEGIQEIGRVSQKELYKEFAESGVWFYPTEFYEISCITAMQAQGLGAIPVCTPYAALNETVSSKYGVKVELDNIAEAMIYTLKNPDEKKRKEMMKWAEKEYSMKNLAKEWDIFFNED